MLWNFSLSVPATQREGLKGEEETESLKSALFYFFAQMLPKILSKFTAASMLRNSWYFQYNPIFSGIFLLDTLYAKSWETFFWVRKCKLTCLRS